jgi:anti-sigma factor RsiW
MNGHLSAENIELYRRREIDSARQRETETHLASCESCLKRVIDAGHTNLAFNSLNEALLPHKDEAPFHLSKAQLRNYLEGGLDGADGLIFNSHLEECERCQAEIKALTTEPVPETPVSHKPSPAPKRIEPRRHWPSLAWLTPARAVAAIAIVGLIAFALIQWRRQQSPTGPARAESQTNQDELQPHAAGSDQATGTTPEPAQGADPPSLVVLKDNNREIKLAYDGTLSGLEGVDETTQRAIRAALKGVDLAKPDALTGLSAPKIELLGTPEGESFQLISPLGKVVVEQRPRLRWRPVAKANSYVVSIFDENFNRVAQSLPLTTTQWTTDVSLKRGQTYSWEVTAIRDGKEIVSPTAPAPAAKFSILDAKQQNLLANLRRQTPPSHLALGLAYADAGLVADAEREFRQLVKENPESAVAEKLLRTVLGWR